MDNDDHLFSLFDALFKDVHQDELALGAASYLLALLYHYERVGVTCVHDADKPLAQPFSEWLESGGIAAMRNLFLMPASG